MAPPMAQNSRPISLRASAQSRNRPRPYGLSRRSLVAPDDDPSSLVGHRIFADLRTRNDCRNDVDYRGNRASLRVYDEALRAIKSRIGDRLRNAECRVWIFLVLSDWIRRRAFQGNFPCEVTVNFHRPL